LRTRAVVAALSFILSVSCAKGRAEPGGEVIVAAAASLRGVLPAIASSYEKTHKGTRVTMTFGASGELAQQVSAGAPVDVVVFAGGAPVEDLIRQGLVDRSSRYVIATNRLVLIGPKGSEPGDPSEKRKVTFATLALIPTDAKIAVGDPRSVPAGQYAKVALERLHEWDALEGRMVYASDVSAALAYARRGEVLAAIVYETELHGVSDVDVFDTLADGLAPRPEVVAAIASGSHTKEAALGFLRYLEGAETKGALLAYGFGPP
jgi:molybdate transport system substrate-binding protein